MNQINYISINVAVRCIEPNDCSNCGRKEKEPNILLLYKSESKYESKTYAVSLSNFPCYTF